MPKRTKEPTVTVSARIPIRTMAGLYQHFSKSYFDTNHGMIVRMACCALHEALEAGNLIEPQTLGEAAKTLEIYAGPQKPEVNLRVARALQEGVVTVQGKAVSPSEIQEALAELQKGLTSDETSRDT